jgi:hypothetical protein
MTGIWILFQLNKKQELYLPYSDVRKGEAMVLVRTMCIYRKQELYLLRSAVHIGEAVNFVRTVLIIIIIIYVMELGHLLTRSGLTYPEVSSKVCHYFFCQLGNSVSLPWVMGQF